jgi:hypothetical protein
LAALALLAGAAPPARADFINPDFNSGTLTGWTPFTTSDGTNGTGLPNVVSFNTTGSGASPAAHFHVGQVTGNTGLFEGGGILQSLNTPAGNFTVSLDFAADNPNTIFSNSQGGRIQLLVDGVAQSPSFTTGFITTSQTIRAHLDIPVSLTAGSHEFRFQITRNFLEAGAVTEQYLDNLHITPAASAVPEPSSLALLALGACGLLGYVRRCKAAR